MKSHTDIKQSKKLADILPKESADQTWEIIAIAGANLGVPEEMQYWHNGNTPCILNSKIGIPCWSLAALIELMGECRMERTPLDQSGEFTYSFVDNYYNIRTVEEDNAVDAAVEMILKLHEQKLL
jgi:hypothetical protein